MKNQRIVYEARLEAQKIEIIKFLDEYLEETREKNSEEIRLSGIFISSFPQKYGEVDLPFEEFPK